MSFNNNNTTNRPLSNEALAAIPVLRSLIISEKGTSTLRRILTDYCKEEGEPLPFQRFGFPSAVEYLKATGEFILRTHLGETSIFVKPKQGSNHIQKMVAAQKDAKQMPKRKNVYHWNNPQYKFRNGYQQTSQPQSSYSYPRSNNSSSNPLKRFFPTNATAYYPKIDNRNENLPPKPSLPPKVVLSQTAKQTVSYANVANCVKLEQPERKPLQLAKIYENVPPLPVIIPQQAYVRPQPNNYFVAKREAAVSPNLSHPSAQVGLNQNQVPSNAGQNQFCSHPSYHAMQTAPKNNQNQFLSNVQPNGHYVEPVKNQNRFPSNPFQSDQFVQPAKNTCTVQAQNQPSTNPFTGCQRSPPGFNFPASLPRPFVPNSNQQVAPIINQHQNGTNPFKPFYQQPQQVQNSRTPFAQLQLHQPGPPAVPTSNAGEQIIDLLDQQVQLLHNSVKSFKNSYQTSRVLLQSTLHHEVEMMEAIVHHYQQTVCQQQQRQQAAVERLNQQLELLHESCRTGTGY